MVKFAALFAAAASLALAASASAQSGQARDPAAALGRTIASAATTAERAAPEPDAIQTTVRVSVQQVIIGAAAEPQVVLAALDTALAACRPPSGRVAPDWTCPATPAAYLALNGLRLIVVAQLEQIDPGALNGPGSAAFGSLMTTAPSAGYTHLPL
jgi:hypothetical protein